VSESGHTGASVDNNQAPPKSADSTEVLDKPHSAATRPFGKKRALPYLIPKEKAAARELVSYSGVPVAIPGPQQGEQL
jgi:hypothetical protein